jgi:hypothetical protein
MYHTTTISFIRKSLRPPFYAPAHLHSPSYNQLQHLKQDKLWALLRTAADALTAGALAAWQLQRVLAKKRDPLSHVLLLDEVCPPGCPSLTQRYWCVFGRRGRGGGRCQVAWGAPPAAAAAAAKLFCAHMIEQRRKWKKQNWVVER